MMHQHLQLTAAMDAAGAVRVSGALGAIAGVGQVQAIEGASQVAVVFDNDRTSVQELAAVLARAGYALRPARAHGGGSCCGGCGG